MERRLPEFPHLALSVSYTGGENVVFAEVAAPFALDLVRNEKLLVVTVVSLVRVR